MPEQLNPDLIRRYADGEELSAAEVARIEARSASDGEVRAQVAFERELRNRIPRVFEHASKVPASLRARVQAAIAAEAAGDGAEPGVDDPAKASPAKASPVARPPWWASPQRANFFYVAATVALIVGAVLFGILTPSIDQRQAVDPSIDAAMYVLTEHNRCVTEPEHLNRKAVWRELDEARRRLSDLLGVAIPAADLSGVGYEFLGAGECRVPGPVPSGHLSYVRQGEDSGLAAPMASIFVVADVGQYAASAEFIPFQWYVQESQEADRPVLQMSDGKVVYLLVCCESSDEERLATAISEAAMRTVP